MIEIYLQNTRRKYALNGQGIKNQPLSVIENHSVAVSFDNSNDIMQKDEELKKDPVQVSFKSRLN